MLETMHPSELVRLLDHFDKHVNRVALFVGQQLIETGDPDDQLELEEVYDLWRKWRHKLAISEAAFRTHLRALHLDIFEDGDTALLVGFITVGTVKPPPKAQRTMDDFPMARLDKVLPLCSTVQGVADALHWPMTTLRDWMQRYPTLAAKITNGLTAANIARGMLPPAPMRRSTRPAAARRSTARNYGFASYEDYRAALQAKKKYFAAKGRGENTEELFAIWQAAEAKKRLRSDS